VNEDGGVLRTTTSRALGVLGIGSSLAQAEERAERALAGVKGERLFVRHDIGTPALVEKRVAHMRELRS
jgi:phosphoribosylamine--glycine ligase